jgi:hypothetical protein
MLEEDARTSMKVTMLLVPLDGGGSSFAKIPNRGKPKLFSLARVVRSYRFGQVIACPLLVRG